MHKTDEEALRDLIPDNQIMFGDAARVVEVDVDRPKKAKTIRAIGDKYPELDAIASEVAQLVGGEINSRVQMVESEMPYRAQYVLEELIKMLEQAV